MSNNCKSIEERVDGITDSLQSIGVELTLAARAFLVIQMQELARDQRHLCAETVNEMEATAIGGVSKDETHSRVFNARIK